MTSNRLHIILAAGGTGGHMMPADVLADELRQRGHRVSFVTDDRGARLPDLFEEGERLVLQARPNAGLLGRLKFYTGLLAGIFQVKRQFRAWKPDMVVGFGGYPSAPAMIAARLLGLPTMLHEQNAILGRTNRLVAKRASMIALTFPKTQRLPDGVATILTGLPVRNVVRQIGLYEAPAANEKIDILVTGGSQGARILSDVVPEAFALLPGAVRKTVRVSHQARTEDVARVQEIYGAANVEADVQTYYTDLPERLSSAGLVIARAGASTIAELTVAGRASILVPLAIAMDDHQAANVEFMPTAACWDYHEGLFEPDRISDKLKELLGKRKKLEDASRHARAAGIPDAAERLANVIEEMAGASARKDAA